MSISNNYSVGLWLGRANRSGSLTERFINYFPVGLDPYEMIGNPQIRAETNNQLDANYSLGRPQTRDEMRNDLQEDGRMTDIEIEEWLDSLEQ